MHVNSYIKFSLLRVKAGVSDRQVVEMVGVVQRRWAEFNILMQPCPREADDSSSAATPVEEEDSCGHAVSTEEVEQRQLTEAEVVVHRRTSEVEEGQADIWEEIEEIIVELENVRP